jgi:hypothetical protein
MFVVGTLARPILVLCNPLHTSRPRRSRAHHTAPNTLTKCPWVGAGVSGSARACGVSGPRAILRSVRIAQNVAQISHKSCASCAQLAQLSQPPTAVASNHLQSSISFPSLAPTHPIFGASLPSLWRQPTHSWRQPYQPTHPPHLKPKRKSPETWLVSGPAGVVEPDQNQAFRGH